MFCSRRVSAERHAPVRRGTPHTHSMRRAASVTDFLLCVKCGEKPPAGPTLLSFHHTHACTHTHTHTHTRTHAHAHTETHTHTHTDTDAHTHTHSAVNQNGIHPHTSPCGQGSLRSPCGGKEGSSEGLHWGQIR